MKGKSKWYVVLDDGDTFGVAEGAWLVHIPEDKDTEPFEYTDDLLAAADVDVSLTELVRMLDCASVLEGLRRKR